jgi:hypothetical protein
MKPMFVRELMEGIVHGKERQRVEGGGYASGYNFAAKWTDEGLKLIRTRPD